MISNPSADNCLCLKKSGVLRTIAFQALNCLLILLCCVCCVSCDVRPKILIDGGAVRAESYMWCEHAILDRKWGIRAGFINKGAVNPPYNMPNNLYTSGYPFPSELEIRWFHFGKQKYYEAKLIDPALEEKAAAFIESHGAFGYDKSLYISIYDSGKVEIWLGLLNMRTHGEDYIELLGAAQGYEAEGDKSNYIDLTIQAIEEGLLPESVLDLNE